MSWGFSCRFGCATLGCVKNIEIIPFKHASSFRRIAAVSWGPPRDPTIYGSVVVRAEKLQAWLEAERARTGERLTVTHAVARAAAIVFKRHPDLNAFVRGSALVLRQNVDVFVQVAIPSDGRLGETDLSGVVVRGADQKDIGAIAREVSAGARRIRKGEDKAFQTTKGQALSLPGFLFRLALRFITFLQYRLNLNPSFLGAPPDPFGSLMVTSMGMMGVSLAFAPFFPLGVTPLVLLVGAVEDTVVPEHGQPVVVKAFRLNGTMDHRVIDGVHAALISKELLELLENPERLALEQAPAEGGGGGGT